MNNKKKKSDNMGVNNVEISDDKKQRLVEYRKKIWESKIAFQIKTD